MSTMQIFTQPNTAVSWKHLVVPALLALFTTLLSAIAVFNPNNFYTAMGMTPLDNSFMTLSWAARNTAIAAALWLAVLVFRSPQPLLVALGAHLTMDLLDLLVDLQTRTPPAVMVWVFIAAESLMIALLLRALAAKRQEKK